MKCGKPVEKEETEFCRDCRKHSLAYTQGKSLWLHREPVSHAIYQFKYHNKRVYAKVFAEELAKRYGRQVYKWKIEEILPINTEALFRVKRTKPQKKLDDKERGENMQGAFGVAKAWKVKNNVLLIDDIYTTGNTIHTAAKILKKAGVQNVYFLTISIGQGL